MTAQTYLFPASRTISACCLHIRKAARRRQSMRPKRRRRGPRSPRPAGGSPISGDHHHADHTAGIGELKQYHNAAWSRRATRPQRIPTSTRRSARTTGARRQARKAASSTRPPYGRSHLLYFSRRQARLRGDTLFSIGCGSRHRGECGDMWTRSSSCAICRRRAVFLRPRIHAGQHPLRQNHRRPTTGARLPRRGGRKAPAAGKATIPATNRRREGGQSVPAVPTTRNSPDRSGSPGTRREVFADIPSARTGFGAAQALPPVT